MKKRLTMALAAGALVAAMLPGAASALDALDPCAAADPSLVQLRECITIARVELKDLYKEMDQTAKELQQTIKEIQNANEALSVGDMLEMQLLMDHLSELAATSASVVSAADSTIMSMGRNVKA